MNVIVATANTLEQWENYHRTLGVFEDVDSFERWLYDHYQVLSVEPVTNFSKYKTYYIYGLYSSFTDDNEKYYYKYIDTDGEEYRSVDEGEYVSLKEFEII